MEYAGLIRIALIGALSLAAGGCGIFSGGKSEVVFDEAQGVDARQLAKSLPNDLKGDDKNKRYLMSPMMAEGIAAEDEDGE